MIYVNDITITEAILHVVDVNTDKPILNEYKLDLTEDVYKYIYKHVERCLKAEDIMTAKFIKTKNYIMESAINYVEGNNNDFIKVSQTIASYLHMLIYGNGVIPSCDLLVVSLITDQGPLLGILKMDYVKNFTHSIDFEDEKIGINIVNQQEGLPPSNSKIQKAAFIKPRMNNDNFDLWVLDKVKKSNKEDYGANYFINNFLNCNVIQNDRDMTKNLMKNSENWTRRNMQDDAKEAERIRNQLKDVLKRENLVDIDGFSRELFPMDEYTRKKYLEFLRTRGVEEKVQLDKMYVDKKLSKVRLKLDDEIDLFLSEDTYNNPTKFEINDNGDGTINMTIKYIKSYKEN